MNNSNLVKIIIAVVMVGIVAVFAKNYIQFSLPYTKPNNANTATPPKNSLVSQETGLKVGEAFPSFTLTDVEGVSITNEIFKGKPAIIWFTTSWCVPCQIGGQKVSKLDDELGGKAFNVLVVFVDPREQNSDLINWRKQFASSDWIIGFDNKTDPLAQKVNLKFLDSKYILDKKGVIKNIDFQQANESYLNTIREVVKEN